MFRCTACIRRTLLAVFPDVVVEQPLLAASRSRPQHLRRSRYRLQQQHSSYATAASATLRTPDYSPPNYTSFAAAPVPVNKSSSPTPSYKPHSRKKEGLQYSPAELQREVRWLRDPLKLADRTVALLNEDLFVKALGLVRLASKDLLCTVSWNHLVDYEMSRGKANDAFKLYNEMKKRAQIPDARTFTTLFRGFALHAKTSPIAVQKSVSIYLSMFNDNAPVKPSIIHTNAVLKVCALAGDMDALLGVAAKLPERGHGAPDTLTYTVILNAVRNSALVHRIKHSDLRSGPEKGAIAVDQGRQLWGEIRSRWVKGDLLVDEELVCAMGRVLLLGGEVDADDVLSLLEQTMAIPRQVPRIGDPARHGVRNRRDSRSAVKDGDMEGQAILSQPSSSQSSAATPSHLPPLDAHAAAASPFAPLPNLPDTTAVQPRCNTLSLALEACTRMSLPRPAQDYWGLLTAPKPAGYDIHPDGENYTSYLRLLRLQRASKLATDLVDEIKDGSLVLERGSKLKLEPKIFRMAMSACARDKNNPNALTYANKLARTMFATLEDADAKTLTSYLEGAIRGHRKNDWEALLEVETLAMEGWRNLKSLISYGSGTDERAFVRPNDQVMEFARMFNGLYDRLLVAGREKMDSKERNRITAENARIATWIQRRTVGKPQRGSSAGVVDSLDELENENEDVQVRHQVRGQEQKGETLDTVTPTETTTRSQDPGNRTLRGHSKSFSFRPRSRDIVEEEDEIVADAATTQKSKHDNRNNPRGRYDDVEDVDVEENEGDDDDETPNPQANQSHSSNSAYEFAPDPRPRDRLNRRVPPFAVSSREDSPRREFQRRDRDGHNRVIRGGNGFGEMDRSGGGSRGRGRDWKRGREMGRGGDRDGESKWWQGQRRLSLGRDE